MAVHTLGSTAFKNLKFSEDLWKDIDTSRIRNLVNNFYPEISRVTSKSENLAFAWLYGRVQVKGKGTVKVTYPYVESSNKVLTFRNVSFSQYPYVILKAEIPKSSKFKGWKDSVTGKVLSEETTILISKDSYPESTGFIAEFEDYDNSLGV